MMSTRFHLATIYLASALCLTAVLVLGLTGCEASRPPGVQGDAPLNGGDASGRRSGLKVRVGDGVDVEVGNGVDVKVRDGVDVNVDKHGVNVDVKPGGQEAGQP